MGLEDDMIPDEPEENPDVPKLSKKARKARDKLSVAELKVRCLILPFLPSTYLGRCADS
jgi:hypothetical protein